MALPEISSTKSCMPCHTGATASCLPLPRRTMQSCLGLLPVVAAGTCAEILTPAVMSRRRSIAFLSPLLVFRYKLAMLTKVSFPIRTRSSDSEETRRPSTSP